MAAITLCVSAIVVIYKLYHIITAGPSSFGRGLSGDNE